MRSSPTQKTVLGLQYRADKLLLKRRALHKHAGVNRSTWVRWAAGETTAPVATLQMVDQYLKYIETYMRGRTRAND